MKLSKSLKPNNLNQEKLIVDSLLDDSNSTKQMNNMYVKDYFDNATKIKILGVIPFFGKKHSDEDVLALFPCKWSDMFILKENVQIIYSFFITFVLSLLSLSTIDMGWVFPLCVITLTGVWIALFTLISLRFRLRTSATYKGKETFEVLQRVAVFLNNDYFPYSKESCMKHLVSLYMKNKKKEFNSAMREVQYGVLKVYLANRKNQDKQDKQDRQVLSDEEVLKMLSSKRQLVMDEYVKGLKRSG